jgi:hypothetical protein
MTENRVNNFLELSAESSPLYKITHHTEAAIEESARDTLRTRKRLYKYRKNEKIAIIGVDLSLSLSLSFCRKRNHQPPGTVNMRRRTLDRWGRIRRGQVVDRRP